MLKLLVFILIAVTLILLSIFITGLMELHKQEQDARKSIGRDGLEGYLDQIFGFGAAKIFKTVFDAEGNLGYLVYLPQYKWFQSPTYKWYEVYATNTGFQHSEI